MQNGFTNYGIDWDGPVPAPSPESVEVPETRCPIDPERLQSLSLFYPPHNASKCYVIEVFVRAVTHVYEMLNPQHPT